MTLLRRFADWLRAQPRLPWPEVLIGVGGATLTLSLLGLLADPVNHVLMAAAFGSSCVLVFTFPRSPLSRIVPVIGGHMVAGLVGMTFRTLFAVTWWSIALSVGTTILLMAALKVMHPPAGGTPIAIQLGQEHWIYLLTPILVGAVIIALGGAVVRALRRKVGVGDDEA